MSIHANFEKLFEKFGNENQIYIIPTLGGLIFIATIITSMIIGVLYANNMVLLTSFVIGSVFFLSMFTCHQWMAKLKINAIRIQSQYAGAPHPSTILIEKKILNNIPYEVRLHTSNEIIKKQIYFKDFEGKFSLPATKRGHYKVNRVKISTTYPFGFFRSWRFFKADTDFYTYPRPKRYTYKVTPVGHDSEGGIVLASNNKEEFHEHKKYTPGDDLSDIDWKTYAKTKKLLVKTYASSSDDQKLFLDYRDIPSKNIEEILEKISYVLGECHNNGVTWSILLPHTKIEGGNSYYEFQQSLKELSKVDAYA